jgi:hypothetical protein
MLSRSLWKSITKHRFSTYKINLGKLNYLEVDSDEPLHPLLINYCNELSKTDQYAQKPMLLMKKFDTIMADYFRLDPKNMAHMNNSLNLIRKHNWLDK